MQIHFPYEQAPHMSVATRLWRNKTRAQMSFAPWPRGSVLSPATLCALGELEDALAALLAAALPTARVSHHASAFHQLPFGLLAEVAWHSARGRAGGH